MNDVSIREVGPRDGLQSLREPISPIVRRQLVEDLSATGLSRIEIGSFVSSKAVPQMSGTDELTSLLKTNRISPLTTEGLVVNLPSVKRAITAGIDRLVFLLSASETFGRRNVKMSKIQTLSQLRSSVALASEYSVPLSASISTAFGCAYEGPVPDCAVLSIAESAAAMGIQEIHVCDTVGMAGPRDIKRLISQLMSAIDSRVRIGLHLHNTRGLGLVNVMAGLESGVRLFDSSIGGLGGCPFSPGATGNISTEDLVHLLTLNGMGTGVNLTALVTVVRRWEPLLGGNLPGQVIRAGPSWDVG